MLAFHSLEHLVTISRPLRTSQADDLWRLFWRFCAIVEYVRWSVEGTETAMPSHLESTFASCRIYAKAGDFSPARRAFVLSLFIYRLMPA